MTSSNSTGADATDTRAASADDLVDRIRDATALLAQVATDRTVLDAVPADDRARLHAAIAAAFHPDRKARKERQKNRERERNAENVRRTEALLDSTGIRELRRKPVFTTPNYLPPRGPDRMALESPAMHVDSPGRESPEVLTCYVCKQKYTQVHHFYDQLCPPCADFNFFKRGELADLRGRVALLTGGRVKIGYQAGIKLLRAGARLIVTTRFPRDSAMRYAQEPDFAEWSDRLEIFGLDLRHTPSVEAFCSEMLRTHDQLDFIINNACQTVRRPPGFYAHMMEGETAALHDAPEEIRRLVGRYEGLRSYTMLPEGDVGQSLMSPDASALHNAAGLTRAAELSQVPLLADELLGQKHLFPEGQLDKDLQQVDLRGRNSWRLLMHEVPAVELLETQLVNAVAPFIINARLKPLMLRTPGRDKHIVNVSAVEGQFYRNFKTTRHPHTNMAKAALNMMTRTSAADYQVDGIHMNSVDTGWVTDEDPVEIAARKVVDERFHPPLDIVDGAARIVDPIIHGIKTGEHVWGQFLKDYRPTDW
ncbi:SDR family NAD(P)-dependent oxidoreductase [Lysobacter sp. TY2-98]|uniref:SDR family NAD(P)-dependent oxidoreductase n=1 Tax=Lysobacter sp. TY2-98 TaxID=2290922 RepID=UPI000E1FB7F8|nr:SDR family oxidoreductase [Lysobacter sp. TY2-98]AXK71322.1 SDR family NAD(P)-dependent oxidoreductase [Lysobacter sp. TY2-98]